MEMENEREVKMIEFEMDLEEKMVEGLIEYAKANMVNDTNALINWAVNDILKKVVESDGQILGDEVKEMKGVV